MADGGHGRRNGAVEVAHLHSADLLGGFVRALADACRAGLPARLSLGSGYVSTSHGVIDAVRDAASLLEAEVAFARERADKARRLAVACASDEETEAYVQEAANWARSARDAESRLAALDEGGSGPAPLVFTSDISVLRTALGRLATADERFTLAEYNAFRAVVPDLRLTARADGSWLGSAVVRLPVEGGVAELGPVTWVVQDRGVGTISAQKAMHRPGVPAEADPEVRHQIEGLPDLTWQAAKTATNAPFAELSWVLLHALAGAQMPAWVAPEWRQPAFMAHVAAIYADPHFAWMGRGQYARLSPIRQAIVDLAVEHDGVTLKDLQSVVPWATWRTLWAAPKREKDQRIRTWERPYGTVDATPSRDRHAKAIRCWCGDLATTVIRAPEVLGDLLCPNGHAPLAPSDLRRTLVFPEPYQRLRLSRERWLAGVTTPRAAQPATQRPPRRHGQEMLAHLDGRPEGRTTAELAALVGRGAPESHATLEALARSGWVIRTPTRPCRWILAATLQETAGALA